MHQINNKSHQEGKSPIRGVYGRCPGWLVGVCSEISLDDADWCVSARLHMLAAFTTSFEPCLNFRAFIDFVQIVASNGGNGGLITYGALDTKNCDATVNYVPLSAETYWQFPIDGFSIGTYSETKKEQVSPSVKPTFCESLFNSTSLRSSPTPAPHGSEHQPPSSALLSSRPEPSTTSPTSSTPSTAPRRRPSQPS